MRIANNIQSLNIINKQKINGNSKSKSIQTLSSGLRINQASDDAAGLSISQKMRAQIRGLNQSSRNAQDGISLIQTTEGALEEMSSMAHRMRELCVQGANDTLTDDDRDKIQLELDELKSEMSGIANRTEFNGIQLLEGKCTDGTITRNFDPALSILTDGTVIEETFDDIFPDMNINIKVVDSQSGNVSVQLGQGSSVLSEASYPRTTVKPSIEWEKSLPSYADNLYGMSSTDDGGFITTGYNSSSAQTVAKFDANGNEEWNQNVYMADSIKQTSDGGYVATGYGLAHEITNIPTPGDGYWHSDIHVTKLDSTGNVEWSNSFNRPSESEFSFNIKETQDGGFIIAGQAAQTVTTNLPNPGDSYTDSDQLLLKIDNTGNQDWIRQYSGTTLPTASTDDSFYDVTEASDGTFIAVGEASVSASNDNAVISKFDSSGNTIWSKSLDLNNYENLKSLQLTDDNAIIAVGITGNDSLVTKFDLNGNELWTNTFGGTGWDEAMEVQALNDGSYLVSHISDSNNGNILNNKGNADHWLTRINNDGSLDWQMNLGTAGTDYPVNAYQTIDGGYFVAYDGPIPTVTKLSNSLEVEVPATETTGVNNILIEGTKLNIVNDKLVSVSFDYDGSLLMHIGANQGQNMKVAINDMRPEALGMAGGFPKVNPLEMAGVSITISNDAINKINAERSKLGAKYNALEHVIANVENSSENLLAAESRITDTDMAKEMMEFSKIKILEEAANTMLAQSNQQPQGILQLIK